MNTCQDVDITAPTPPQGTDNVIVRAGRGGGDLPSLVEALIDDRDRADGARRALLNETAIETCADRFGLLGAEHA